jgi:streptomycin 6-kinase
LSAELAALLPGLKRMGLLADTEKFNLTPLTGGVSSLIVKVDTADKQFCVKRALPQLKVSAVWEAPVRRNRDEVAWLKYAQAVTPGAVPQVLAEDAQDCIFAMAYLPAEQYPVWKHQLMQGQIQPDTAELVAQTLVKLHAASARNPSLLANFDHDDDFVAIRLSPYFLYTAEKHSDCATALQTLVHNSLAHKRVLIHGDVSPKNILVGSHGPVLLDAECACWGDAAFDLAFVLTHLLLKCVHLPKRTADFLRCFDVLSHAYIQGVDWEAADLLEARACGLLAGMLLARVDGKSPVEYLTRADQHDFIRNKAIPWLQHPVSRLAQMRQQWTPS